MLGELSRCGEAQMWGRGAPHSRLRCSHAADVRPLSAGHVTSAQCFHLMILITTGHVSETKFYLFSSSYRGLRIFLFCLLMSHVVS